MFFLFQGCILRFHVDLPGWIGSKFLEIVPACWLALRNGRIFPTKSASKRRLFIWPPGLEKWLSASLPLKKEKALHPRKPTWIPKMMVWKRWSPLNMAIFGIYVRFLGGKKKRHQKKVGSLNSTHHAPEVPRTSHLFQAPFARLLQAGIPGPKGRWYWKKPDIWGYQANIETLYIYIYIYIYTISMFFLDFCLVFVGIYRIPLKFITWIPQDWHIERKL